ncbi:MAG: secondary thiamine-phosphate synthase enzyme YjbQ [bacterium]
MIKRFNVSTELSTELIDITQDVQHAVTQSKVSEGSCTVFIPHTTAGIVINENADPCVVRDFLVEINKVVMDREYYTHAEGNSSAHIKANLVGTSENIFIEGGKLLLGTWQGIFFCEFDGPRTRNVWVKITKEK